ncbi:hypothetical protein AB7Z98_00015 [Providencia manganoxydans]|uniref:hypothetical protein n=1 Tax=Providencia manganoxydans TaxID=2923283 RepID=UPI0034E54011
MFIKIFTRLFNWQPKPLAYNQYAKVLNDNYQISSQNPATLTYKESGYLLVKSQGEVHVRCNGLLVLRLKRNINIITIGWIGNKTQILDIKHNIFTSSRGFTSSNSRHYSTTTTSSESSSSSHEQRSSNSNDSYECSSSGSDSCGGDSGGGGGD